MTRDRDAVGLPPRLSLPLVLAAAAVVAALLATTGTLPALFASLALLLVALACLLAGALWSRQRQLERLAESRQERLLLGQLLDAWVWQTDRDHRLQRLQPPHGAPGSSWVDTGSAGQLLWQRLADDEGSLAARMAAQAALPELTVRSLLPQGPRRWRLRGQPKLDAAGDFCGYIGTLQPLDDAERRQAAAGAFEALLSEAPVALCIALPDGEDGRLRLSRANRAACRLLSIAPEDANGLPWDQLLGALPAEVRERLQAWQPGPAVEAGSWQVWLGPYGEAGDGRGGRLLAIASHDTDSATLALAAEHASFSYTISHDLRAPIRVVEGFTRILKEDYGRVLDRIGNDHLDRVMGAAARMNHMIDALLSLSQLSTQPLARQPVNLSQLAQFVIDDLRRMAPERQVTTHIEPGLTAQGDPTLLRMALENLLGNAWKYSAKNPQAELRFEQVEHGGRRAYVVADNGAGFDMRFADRLFGVFQRLHSSSDFQGTGVGLASVRRIIRRHGGEIWAESEVGQGARFYFTLKA